jgi:DNA-binding NarL/FixJ family response regulator
VDGHEAVREGLRVLLARQGFEVCGEAAEAEQALKGVAASTPDVAVVGLNLPEDGSLNLIAELSRQGLPVVAYGEERILQRIGADRILQQIGEDRVREWLRKQEPAKPAKRRMPVAA